jgi:hypothetical protein
MRGKRPAFMRHVRAAYRSGLEVTVAAALTAAGIAYKYEQLKVPFLQPAKAHTYTPDFLLPNGIIVETKGLFDASDRQKHQWVRAQHPALDIRITFSNAQAKLYKGSKRSYADWCDGEGIKWSHKTIPPEWLTEPADPHRVAAVAALTKA